MPQYTLSVSPEAELDIAEGYCWYEEQAQLGAAFMAAVGKQLEHIEAHPFSYAVVAHDIRRSVVHRFPYNVYYAVNGEFVDVLAVWQGSRDQESLLLSRLGPEFGQ